MYQLFSGVGNANSSVKSISSVFWHLHSPAVEFKRHA